MVFDSGKKYDLDRVVRLVISGGLIAAFVWLLSLLRDVLIPFAAALLLAYLLDPLVVRLECRVKRRALAVFLSLFAAIAAALVLLAVTVPMVTDEVRHLGRIFRDARLAEQVAARLPAALVQPLKELIATREIGVLLQNDDWMKLVDAALPKLMPGLYGIVSGAAGLLTALMGLSVVALYVVFLLFDFQKVKNGWQSLIPPDYRSAVIAFVSDFSDAMQRYFRAQAAVSAITGILFAAGFSLIGLPGGIVLGLFVGLLSMVPYLQAIGLVPAALLAVAQAIDTGGSIGLHLGLAGLVFVVVQIVQDALLVPRIMGKVTGMSPAIMLLSLSVFGELLGLFGLLIALPMTCLLYAYYRRLLESAAGRREETTPS